MPISSSLSVNRACTYPFLIQECVSYDKCFFLVHNSSSSSSSATGMQPFLKYTFSGVLNHSIFSLLSATVLMFSRCFTPTFSDTELPPQEPHPSVRDGAKFKVVKITDTTVRRRCIDQNTAGLHTLLHVLPSFLSRVTLTYREDVCPYPPSATSCSAFASASSNVFCFVHSKYRR